MPNENQGPIGEAEGEDPKRPSGEKTDAQSAHQDDQGAPNPPLHEDGRAVAHKTKEASSTLSSVGLTDPRNFSRIGQVYDRPVGQVRNVDQQSASNIALIITCTFAGCAAFLLVGLYLILRHSPVDAKILLEAATPFLKESGTFLSTVFGPLLGFVLGYYFRERKDQS